MKRSLRAEAPAPLRTSVLQKLILFHPRDNVGVAVQDITKGEVLLVGKKLITARDAIMRGHKIAVKDIPRGANIIKLGLKIGKAKRRIRTGEHVHIHNVKSLYE